MLELKDVWGQVLFTAAVSRIKELVILAVKQGANLDGANLDGANLDGANLAGANLNDLKNINWLICPEVGSFVAFKAVKTSNGDKAVLRVRIDSETARTNGIGSRKCRAERVFVLGHESGSVSDKYLSPTADSQLEYHIGQYVIANSYVDDPRLECTGGIHFFMTKKEA